MILNKYGWLKSAIKNNKSEAMSVPDKPFVSKMVFIKGV